MERPVENGSNRHEKSRQRRCTSPVSVDPFASSPLSSCCDSLLSESQNSSLSDLSGEGYSSLSSSSGFRSRDESRAAVPVGRSTKQAVHRETRGNGSEGAWRKTVLKPASKTVAGSQRCRKQVPTQRGRGNTEDDETVDAGDLLNELVSSVTRRNVRVGPGRPSSTSSGDDDADANEDGSENYADVGWRESPHDVNHDRMDSRPPIMRVPRDDSFNGLPSPTLTVSSSVHARILPAPQRMKPVPLYTAPPGKRILSERPGGHPTERHPPSTISASFGATNGSGSDSGTASARGNERKSGVPSSHLALTTQWLSDNFETCDSRISISREKFFYHYQEFAASTAQKLMNQASFGKLLRSLFHLSTRRLGVRGHSKYHYSGIKVKDDSPLKCIAEEIEVESMDFRFNAVPHQRPSIRPKKASGDASLKPKPPSLNPAHPLTSHKRLDGFHGPFGNFSLSTGGWQQAHQPIPLATLASTNCDIELLGLRTLDDGPIVGRYLPPLSIPPPAAAAEDSFDIQQVLQSPLPDSVPPMYPPNSVVLPDFASSRALGKPNAALAKEASGFLAAYQDHCQNMINIFYGPRPGDLPALVHAFWSRVSIAASPLFWQEDVIWDIAMADLTVYSTLLNELDKDPLHPSSVGRLAYLVYNLADWTNSVGQGSIPSYLFEVKNEACRALRDAFNESAATANATVELQCVLDDENRYEALRDRWNRLSFQDLRREISMLLKTTTTASTSKFSLCLEVPKGGRRAVVSTSGQKGGRPPTGKHSSSSTTATLETTVRKRKRSVNRSKHEAYLLTDESNSDRRLNRAINLPSEDELTSLILSHKHDKEEEEAVRRPFAPFLRQPSLRSARKPQASGEQRPTAPVCSEDSTNLDGYAAGTDTDAETETDGEDEEVKSAAVMMSAQEKTKMNERILDSVERLFGKLIVRKAALREWFELLDDLLQECIPLSPPLLQSDYLQRATHFLRQLSFVLQQIVRQQGDVAENELRPLHVLITFLENGTIDRIRKRLFHTKVHWYEEQINGEIARIINPSLSVALDRIGFFATATNAASLAQSATKTIRANNENSRDTPTGLRLSVITGERDPLFSAGNSFPPGISHYANGMIPQFSPGTASSYGSEGCNLAADCESYLDSVMRDAEAGSHLTLDGHGRLLMQQEEVDEAFRYAGGPPMLETNELEAMTIAEGPKFTFSQYSPRQKDIFGMVPDRSSLSKIILPFRLSTT